MLGGLQLYIIGGLVAAAAALGAAAYYQTERIGEMRAEMEVVQQTSDAWRTALEQQRAYTEQLGTMLQESTAGYEKLRRTTGERLRVYETAVTRDSNTDDWDSAGVPSVVAERMCWYTAEAGEPGVPANPDSVHGPAAGSCASQTATYGDGPRN